MSTCKMLSQTLEAPSYRKLVLLMLHFTGHKKHLSLDTSYFNLSKGNDPVEMLKNFYKKATLFSAIDGSSNLIGGILDMLTWQAGFTITQDILVDTEVSDGFVT